MRAEEKAVETAQPLATFGGFILDLAYLNEPSASAATLKGEQKFTLTSLTNSDDVLVIGIAVDAVYSLTKPHPADKGNAAIELGWAGKIPGEMKPGGGAFQTRRSYDFALTSQAGVEYGTMVASEYERKWELVNVTAGLGLDAEVPFSRQTWFDPLYWPVWWIPAVAEWRTELDHTGMAIHRGLLLTVNADYVDPHGVSATTMEGDSRITLGLMFHQSIYARQGLVLETVPEVNWYWDRVINETAHYVAVPIQLYFEQLTKLIPRFPLSAPVISAIYENGRKPPDYEHINGWKFSIGNKFSF
jgi:hypothetical protein